MSSEDGTGTSVEPGVAAVQEALPGIEVPAPAPGRRAPRTTSHELASDRPVAQVVLDLAPPHLRFLVDQYLQRVASEGEDTGIVKVQHQDGSELEWQYRNRACADADGAIYASGASRMTVMKITRD